MHLESDSMTRSKDAATSPCLASFPSASNEFSDSCRQKVMSTILFFHVSSGAYFLFGLDLRPFCLSSCNSGQQAFTGSSMSSVLVFHLSLSTSPSPPSWSTIIHTAQMLAPQETALSPPTPVPSGFWRRLQLRPDELVAA